jgi:colicin import membrane protein
VKKRKSEISPRRRLRGVLLLVTGTYVGIAATGPSPQAAIDPGTDARRVPLSQSSIPTDAVVVAQVQFAQDATVPPVQREKPATPAPSATPDAKPAAAPAADNKPADQKPSDFGQASPPPPGFDGWMGKIRDWLSNANREFQNVIVKGLSTKPPGGGDDEIARKLEETKQEEAKKREADAKAAEEKRKADAKKTDDAKTSADAKKADDAKKAADAKKADAEAKKRLAEKQADEQRKADESKRQREAEAAKAQTTTPPVAPPDTTALDEARQRAERERIEQAAKEAADRIANMRKEEDERAARERQRLAEPTPRRIELRPEPIDRPDPAARPAPRRLTEGGPPYDGLALFEARRRIPRYGGDWTAEPRYRPRGYVRGYRAYHGRHADRCYAAGRRARHGRRYVVAHGDSLWRISRKHYHKGRKYRRIYNANRRIIRNPDLIYPCQRLVVPKKHKRRRH